MLKFLGFLSQGLQEAHSRAVQGRTRRRSKLLSPLRSSTLLRKMLTNNKWMDTDGFW